MLHFYRSSEHFLRRLASRECRKNAGIPSWRRRQCGSVAETWHDSLNRRRKPVMTIWIGGRDSDMTVSLNGWWPKPYMTVWLGGETHMGFRAGFRPISYAAIPCTASTRPRKDSVRPWHDGVRRNGALFSLTRQYGVLNCIQILKISSISLI